jgi:hypothetical protein
VRTRKNKQHKELKKGFDTFQRNEFHGKNRITQPQTTALLHPFVSYHWSLFFCCFDDFRLVLTAGKSLLETLEDHFEVEGFVFVLSDIIVGKFK